MYVRTLLIMFVIIWESYSAGIYLFILRTYVCIKMKIQSDMIYFLIFDLRTYVHAKYQKRQNSVMKYLK